MSAAKKTEKHSWEMSGPWAGAYKIFGGIGLLGLAGALAGGFAMGPESAKRFAFSWVFAFMTVLSIALGSIFFVLIQRLTSAGWSVTVRRTAEFFGSGVLVLIPLFLPVLFFMNTLFPWLNHGGAGHEGAAKEEHHSSLAIVSPAYAQGHGDPAPHTGDPAGRLPGAHGNLPADEKAHGAGTGHGDGTGGGAGTGTGGHGANTGGHKGPADHAGGAHHRVGPGMPDPHTVIHGELMERKTWWLTKNFFLGRVVLYFVVWAFMAMRLFGWSVAQDKSKDPELTLAAQRFSPPMTFLFGLTLTGAAIDWIMSLEPTWFSTIWGVVYFATGVVSSLAVIILVTMALKDSGPLKGAVTIEHYHDLGKLLFGFNVFWAYVSFSQFMLIWYAALPEETTWYHNRWDYAPWSTVSIAVLLVHFVFPFFWLISRNFKRNLGRLKLGALTLLVAHVVDIYWFVLPNYKLGQDGFTFHWLDLACLLAVGGVYGAFVFYRMTQYSLVPVGDPRLERSLHFQNA